MNNLQNFLHIHSNLKITFIMFFIFALAFSTLLVFLEINQSLKTELDIRENIFYSSEFDPSKEKIYLIGSSAIGVINASYINEKFDQNSNYYLYNLATTADLPINRIESINDIISTSPELVLFGIGYRDFFDESTIDRGTFNKPTSSLPDPQSHFAQIFTSELVLQYNFEPLICPQCIISNIIQNISGFENISFSNYKPDTPFYPKFVQTKNDISNSRELEDNVATFPPPKDAIIPIDKNKNFDALKNMIKNLQKNNIKVAIFTIPYSQQYLDSISINDHNKFVTILNDLEDKNLIQIYDLKDNYVNLKIWNDPTHVIMNKDINIYNDDIFNIILNELD